MTLLRAWALRRNGDLDGPAVPPPDFRRSLPQAIAALQAAALANLDALLGGGPPLALGPAGLSILDADDAQPPVGGMPPAGAMPDRVARVLRSPAATAAMFDIRRGFAHDILLPEALSQAFSDGAFRFAMAGKCHDFLRERVIFLPGGPPEARISPWGAGLLVASQAQHGSAIGARAIGRLRAHVQDLADPGRGTTPWDEWLVRRMAASGAWAVPAGLATLPWVAWRQGDAIDPAAMRDGALPECWASILDLTP